jgi:exodeoxyribonuclease I
MSLVFYDTETTGTDTFFDQILQFAAVRTDADLNEIDRFEIRCRLLPHVVPAPEAMLVTGVNVSKLTDPSFPSHYEMVRAVRAKLLSWSPALFLGWNSIRFDEALFRQALYKTLHNPYLTNRDGNSRCDAMRIVQSCSIFAPAAITIPTDDDGRMVFTLGRIAHANGLKHQRAHDAMGDVEATIGLCRRVIKKAPDIWSNFMRFSTKAAVVDYITEERVFCVSDVYYGKAHSCLVTTVGQSEANKAEWYVFDLSVDPESLLLLSERQLAVRLKESPKPLRRLKSNAVPMLFPAEDAPDICQGLEHGLKELERRAEMVQADSAFRERLIFAFESVKAEYPPSGHVEKQIYDGFVEETDERLMDAFHEADWVERYAIVEEFQDSRLKTIGMRLIHLERPDLLDKTKSRAHHRAAAKRLLGHGDDIPWLTLPQAREQLKELLAAASGAELELLREHGKYLRERHEEAVRTAQ